MNDKKRKISSLLAADFITKCTEYKHLYKLEDSDFIDVISKAIQVAFNKTILRTIVKEYEKEDFR